MQCSEDDVSLFVASTIAWLSIGSRTTGPTAAATKILERISRALEALSKRHGRRNCPGCINSDGDWLEALSYDFRWRRGQFWNLHRGSARRLFHHFETLYSQGALTGDAKDVTTNLHICLERSHEYAEVCEVQGCKWNSHTCESLTVCRLLDIYSQSDDIKSTVNSLSSSEKDISIK